MPDVAVRPATPADRPPAARLWLKFQQDISEIRSALPKPDAPSVTTGCARHSPTDNPGAAGFLRRVATDPAGEAWQESRRPVPGRPELPPDVGLSFCRSTSVPACRAT